MCFIYFIYFSGEAVRLCACHLPEVGQMIQSDDSESYSTPLVIPCTESFGQHDSQLNVNHGEENGGEHSCTEAAPSV